MDIQGIERQIRFYTNMKGSCRIAALIFLAAAAILFWKLRIWETAAEISGRKARKAVKKIMDDVPDTEEMKEETAPLSRQISERREKK